MGKAIATGDRVEYRAAFLRSTGIYTGDIPFAKGIVRGLTPIERVAVAEVEWTTPESLRGSRSRVLTPNLKLVSERELD